MAAQPIVVPLIMLSSGTFLYPLQVCVDSPSPLYIVYNSVETDVSFILRASFTFFHTLSCGLMLCRF